MQHQLINGTLLSAILALSGCAATMSPKIKQSSRELPPTTGVLNGSEFPIQREVREQWNTQAGTNGDQTVLISETEVWYVEINGRRVGCAKPTEQSCAKTVREAYEEDTRGGGGSGSS